MNDPAPKPGKPRLLEWGIGLAVLAGLGWAAFHFLQGGEVLSALRRLSVPAALGVLALGLLYTALKGMRFVELTRAVSALPRRELTRLYWAGEGAALLPGGVALRVAMLAQRGVPPQRGSVPVLLSSVWDQIGFGLCIALLLLLAPETRGFVQGGGWLLFVPLALLLVPGVRRLLAGLLARRLGRWGQDFADALRSSLTLARSAQALALTLLSLAVKVLALHVALLGLGQSAPLALLGAAVILPTAAGRLLPTPGGIGPTEAGMVLLLAGAGVPRETALVAALLYRTALVFFPALLGGLIYLLFWRPPHASHPDLQHERREHRPPSA